MKYKYNFSFLAFLIVFFQISNSYSQSSWEWQNSNPMGNVLQSLYVLGPNSIVAVGKNGTIIKTTDNGLTWNKKYNIGGWGYSAITLLDVQFVNNNTGWVVGEGKTVGKTTDGGESWTLQYQSFGNLAFSRCCFISSTTGWISGSSGAIWKTTNGGTNWTAQSSGVGSNSINELYFLDSLNGWACSGTNILKTTNGGTNWASYSSGITSAPLSLSFINSNTGWACAFHADIGPSYITKTTNGGITWNSTYTFDSIMALCVNFISPTNGICVGGRYNINEKGCIYKTVDGGSSWIKYSTEYQRPILKVKYYTSDIVWAVGYAGEICKSTDGGNSWAELSSGYHFGVRDIFISKTNPNLGWGTGDCYGGYLRTTNGGTNWTVQYMALSGYSPQFNYFNSSYFLNDNTGWMVGSVGRVFKTTNGGDNWVLQNSGSYYGGFGYRDVYFADANTGWIIGTGVIKKSTDGGTSWTLKYNKYYLERMQFVNSQTGFVFGYSDSGIVVRTLDGGESWRVCYARGNSAYLATGYFVNESTGWTAGMGNKICKTTDCGDTWIEQTGGSANNMIFSFFFMNAQTGWAGGTNNQLLYTSNGGTNWIDVKFPTNNTIQDIYFSDANTGWMCGLGGTILKTTNGGLTGFSASNTSSDIPSSYSLNQNYPNPFNPKTTIKYQLTSSDFVKISVYNILGEEIAILKNGRQNAGDYMVEWDASNFSSGIYFYKITTGKFSETKKMMLVK